MKVMNAIRWSSLFIGFCLFFGSTAPLFAVQKVEIAMVLWRGVTKAEEGFQSRLRESKQYEFDFTIFDADRSKEKLSEIIDQLEDGEFRLIYTFGTTATKMVKARIKDTPIIFNIVSRPVQAGVIASWKSSGGNLTGASNAVPMTSAFRTLNRAMHIKRLGFIYNPGEANSRIQRDEIERYQKQFGYVMIDSPIESVDKISDAIGLVLKKKVDAVLLPSDSLVKANANAIVSPLNHHKIPTVVSIPGMVKDNNAFLGLGPDYFLLGKLAAENALAVLNGKEATNVPSKTLDRLHLTVNLKTAKQIGVGIPVQILRISTVIR